MNWRLLLTAFLFLVAACATPGPAPVPSQAETDASQVADAPINAEESGIVAFTESPPVPEEAVVAPPEDLVCRMERRTGTNRKQRVCRPRSPSERDAAAAHQTFETLRRSQQPQN